MTSGCGVGVASGDRRGELKTLGLADAPRELMSAMTTITTIHSTTRGMWRLSNGGMKR
jgi:hypothetical protein